MEGIVIKSTGSFYTVKQDDGAIIQCKLKGKFKIEGLKATNPVVAGDRVGFKYLDDKTTGLINKIQKRKNYIIRKATNLSKLTHIVAANIDNAFLIVTLAEPRTSTGFIDRFLVTAEAYSIPTHIVFNKIDINDKELKNRRNELIEIYTKIGYKCYEVSALKEINIDILKEKMKDKINLFAGHSGVGKSELINKIEPGLSIQIGEISKVHNKGKHTTTFAEMHELSFGGYIIDTPGIKEFGLIDFYKEELFHYFPEIFRISSECQFHNCTHEHEPNCAVIRAVEEGIISETRYKNYINILTDSDMDINEWELR